METYLMAFQDAFVGAATWTWRSMCFEVPWYTNYFWGLVLISLLVWMLEILLPWRKEQGIIRKDFWLDLGYVFFNFFVFSIIISGFYRVLELFFKDLGITMQSIAIIDIALLPSWASLLIFFILLDFVQWCTHLMLHSYGFLWKFHKVHHSVKQMGFAAHLRYHWMENILYKPLKTIGVMLLGGFEPEQAFIVHFVAIGIGHLNHANIKLSWGVLKYILNSPVMHLYHHAKMYPKENPRGVNFGISLSIWDYIFRTNYVPEDSGQIELGFPKDQSFPKSFLGQQLYGFQRNQK